MNKNEAKKKLGIPYDSLTIMFRAAPGEFKGIDIIRDAIMRLQSPKKINLLTVDQKGLLSELQNKHDVREYGWINDDEILSSLYQASDIFLMPSLAESFGLMAVEAMSCADMVLTVDGTALPEIINAPECGIATKRDATAYGAELQRLINNPKEISERGQKSLEYAESHYKHDIYVRKIVSLYEEVIKKHKLSKADEHLLSMLKTHNEKAPIRFFPEKRESSQTKYNSLSVKRIVKRIMTESYRILWRMTPLKARQALKEIMQEDIEKK